MKDWRRRYFILKGPKLFFAKVFSRLFYCGVYCATRNSLLDREGRKLSLLTCVHTLGYEDTVVGLSISTVYARLGLLYHFSESKFSNPLQRLFRTSSFFSKLASPVCAFDACVVYMQ